MFGYVTLNINLRYRSVMEEEINSQETTQP
jgi:hypothetical protein